MAQMLVSASARTTRAAAAAAAATSATATSAAAAAATSPAATATQCRRQGRALSLSSAISHPQMVYNLYIINTLMNYYSLMKNGLK